MGFLHWIVRSCCLALLLVPAIARAQNDVPVPLLASKPQIQPAQPAVGSSAQTYSVFDATQGAALSGSSRSAMGGGSGQLISFADTSYVISPQDVIEVKVYGQPNMDASTRVDARGTINFAPVGQVNVAGLTERQVETLLEQRLRSGNFLVAPHVAVFVKEMHPREVAIIGEVKQPGRYPYFFGSRSLVELIAQAGGTTEKAGGTAFILRFSQPLWMSSPGAPNPGQFESALKSGGIRRIAVDLNDLLINGKASANQKLEPGDIVTIPDAGFVHVTGKGIKTPGMYPLRRGANTLTQFVDLAGGTKWEAASRISIVRGGASGRPGQVERVNYKRLLARESQEVGLNQDDKVIVPRSLPKFVLASIGRGVAKVVNIGAYFNLSQSGK